MPRRLTRKCSRGREAPLDPDEALVGVELLLDLLVLDLRQRRDDLARGIRRIEQQVRIDEGRHHRHRGRQHHAVAVDDVGTLGLDRAAARRDTLRRLGAVAQQRDVAHAQADRAEHHDEDGRSHDQALARSLLHVALEPFFFRPVTRAGRRGGRGGRFGRARFAPQPHRRTPSFFERISSIEVEATWPSPTGPVVAGACACAGRGGVVDPVVVRPEGGAEAGEGLPASAETRPPPGTARRGDVVARSWGGRKWWIAPLLIAVVLGGLGLEGLGLEGIEPDDLLDAGLLELEMLLRQPLDALGLVEMRPLHPEDVGRLLAFDDLLVGAVDLVLEVLHLVLDREETHRRGDGGDRPEQEPAMDHAAPPAFSATRSRAERARGLAETSASRRRHRLARQVAQGGGALLGARRRVARRRRRAARTGRERIP